MITSDKQARIVQERRFNSGKKGVAKSVRRYHKRAYGGEGFKLSWRLPSSFHGCRAWDEVHK